MRLPERVRKSPLAVCIAVMVLVCLGVIGMRSTGNLEFLELAAYDYYLRLRPSISSSSPSAIVLITISEEDIQNQGRWPLSDKTLASLLKKIIAHQPRAVGLDIYRDIPVPPGSDQLKELFSDSQNLVTVKKIGDDKSSTVPAPYMAKNPDLVGFNDIVVDREGIIRRGLLFIDDGQTTSYSFSLILSMLYLQADGIVPEAEGEQQHFRLGKTTYIPFEPNDGSYVNADARGYQFLLDFRDMRYPFPSFSLTDTLAGNVPENAFTDRIVIVGTNAVSLKDFFYTPFSRGMDDDNKIPGIELHARMASQLIKSALEVSRPIRHLSEGNEWLWIILWAAAGGTLGLLGRSFVRFFLLGTVSLCLLVLITYLAFLSGWWIPLIPPALAWVGSDAIVTAYNAYLEKKERAVLMHLFSRHVSPDVASAIWQQREQFMDGSRPRSQKLTATVLFTDLKGFTAVSEKLDPQTLMDWLNEYMEAMAQAVIEHKGVINKYIGDAVMAIFGVPVARSRAAEIQDDAVNAVQCALAMSDRLELLNKNWQERDLPTIKMRVGIYTGELVAGSLGSSQRMEYTVIGDTVNTASRLESFDKDSLQIGSGVEKSLCRILIGGETKKYVEEYFQCRKVAEVALKGKDEKITIYLVMGVKDKAKSS